MPPKARVKISPPFQFPRTAHHRVHGPRGHPTYQAYKPWLRDEFSFRCVYCLTREVWNDAGHNLFTIDHVKPKSLYPKLECTYENLVYACFRCNALKGAVLGLPDPCKVSLAAHLRHRDGRFFALTPTGKRLVALLNLNEPQRVITRQRYLRLFEIRHRLSSDLLTAFGYPLELPDLSSRKPPQGNARDKGVQRSYFARRQAKTLSPYY